jgi:hypothetical protein
MLTLAQKHGYATTCEATEAIAWAPACFKQGTCKNCTAPLGDEVMTTSGGVRFIGRLFIELRRQFQLTGKNKIISVAFQPAYFSPVVSDPRLHGFPLPTDLASKRSYNAFMWLYQQDPRVYCALNYVTFMLYDDFNLQDYKYPENPLAPTECRNQTGKWNLPRMMRLFQDYVVQPDLGPHNQITVLKAESEGLLMNQSFFLDPRRMMLGTQTTKVGEQDA